MILKGILREGMNGVCRTVLAASICQHADQESSSIARLQNSDGLIQLLPINQKGKGSTLDVMCDSMSQFHFHVALLVL